MPRKGYIAKREVLPDPVYNDVIVTKLINNIMLDGKKGTAQKICYAAFDIVKEKTGRLNFDGCSKWIFGSIIVSWHKSK